MAADILFTVADKLAQFARSSSNLSTAYSGLIWIETELRRVHKLLEEDPGLEMNRKELRKWARDLIHAAQNMEDIVDNFDFNLKRRQQRMGCMGSAFFAVKGKVARYKIVAEVKQVKEKMSQICESMPNKQVFGFDKDFDALVKQLVEENDPHPPSLFIVGPCGAGKTTLVKEVYDSDAVKKHFPDRFWFCGQEYKFQGSAFWWKISRAVQEVEKGKRYLIVLDINLIYPGDFKLREYSILEFMSGIRKAVPDERNGSRVVVTCNDKRVADLFGQEIEVRELEKLSSEEKWKLFLNTLDFDATTAETTAGTSLSSSMLEEIVRKQMHLPSEIVNLGDLLSKENRKSSALSNIMLDHPNYYQVDGPERTLLKISSSFDLLESPLKLFLLYCSLFPKGFEIPKRRVLGLWLTEGRLQSEDGGFYPPGEYGGFYPAKERLKRRADTYLKELSHLGLIQVEYSYMHQGYSWINYDFAVKRIRLESPLWDFAAMKAMQYNLSHNIDNEGPPDSRSSISNARVLAFHSSAIYNHIFHDQKVSLPNLRWLLCFPQLTVIGGEVTFPTSRFKLLRVLDLEDMYFITQLSQEIGELVHLRYLGLRRTGLYSLPNSIGNLKNLESLDIRGTRVKPIPTAIQKLERLLYLYMDMDDGNTDDNDSLDVSSLESLRVLSVIRVGRWMEIRPRTLLIHLRKLGIYGDLDYLKGKSGTENGPYLNALHAMLKRMDLRPKLRLFRLGFAFGDIILDDGLSFTSLRLWSLYLERPLQKLPGPGYFPYDLRKLRLKWSLLEQDPMATLEQLKSLAVLKLRCGSFLGKKMLCSAGGFPYLRFLELSLIGWAGGVDSGGRGDARA